MTGRVHRFAGGRPRHSPAATKRQPSPRPEIARPPLPFLLGLVLIVALGAVGCSDGEGPTGPAPDAPLDRSLASQHFDFRFAAGDTITPEEAAINDRAYEIIRDALQTGFARRVEFLKYGGPDHIEALTGRRTGGGFVQNGRIHLTRALDPHEIVHVIAQEELGLPVSFFDEGLAVNFGGLRVEDGTVTLFPSARRSFEVDAEVRTVFADGRFSGSIRPLLLSTTFLNLSFETTYPIAGSFVKFLLQTHGLAPLKAFFAASNPFDPPQQIEADIEAAFGASFAVLEEEWRAAVGLPSVS